MKVEMGKKYRYKDKTLGEARILCIDRPDPVLVPVLSMAKDGRLTRHAKDGSVPGDYNPGYTLVEIKPYDEFEVDEPVMYRCEGTPAIWYKGHFAGVYMDNPQVFANGTTKWSSQDNIWLVEDCRKPTKEELI